MAKFEKVDPKQVPQLVVLGVLALGVFGYAGVTILGSNKKSEPAPSSTGTTATATESGSKGAGEGTDTSVAQTGAPGIQLPGTYNPDPFRPLRTTKSEPVKPVAPARPPRQIRTAQALKWPGNSEAWASLPRPEGGPSGVAPVVPGPPPGPVRPMLLVTGIIDVEEGDDMALIVLDGRDRRILQVGDVVANNYRVKKIAMDGVLLVNGTDRFFVTLGKKAEGDPAAPGQPG